MASQFIVASKRNWFQRQVDPKLQLARRLKSYATNAKTYQAVAIDPEQQRLRNFAVKSPKVPLPERIARGLITNEGHVPGTSYVSMPGDPYGGAGYRDQALGLAATLGSVAPVFGRSSNIATKLVGPKLKGLGALKHAISKQIPTLNNIRAKAQGFKNLSTAKKGLNIGLQARNLAVPALATTEAVSKLQPVSELTGASKGEILGAGAKDFSRLVDNYGLIDSTRKLFPMKDDPLAMQIVKRRALAAAVRPNYSPSATGVTLATLANSNPIVAALNLGRSRLAAGINPDSRSLTKEIKQSMTPEELGAELQSYPTFRHAANKVKSFYTNPTKRDLVLQAGKDSLRDISMISGNSALIKLLERSSLAPETQRRAVAALANQAPVLAKTRIASSLAARFPALGNPEVTGILNDTLETLAKQDSDTSVVYEGGPAMYIPDWQRIQVPFSREYQNPGGLGHEVGHSQRTISPAALLMARVTPGVVNDVVASTAPGTKAHRAAGWANTLGRVPTLYNEIDGSQQGYRILDNIAKTHSDPRVRNEAAWNKYGTFAGLPTYIDSTITPGIRAERAYRRRQKFLGLE